MATTQDAHSDETAQAEGQDEGESANKRRAPQTAPLRIEDDEPLAEAAEAGDAQAGEEQVITTAAAEPEIAAAAEDNTQTTTQATAESGTDNATDWWASSAPAEEQPMRTTVAQLAAAVSVEADEQADETPISAGAGTAELPAVAEPPAEEARPVEEAPVAGDEEWNMAENERPAVEPASAAAHNQASRGLAAAAQRDIGRIRKINQDSVFSLVTCLPREGGDVPLGLFIVADGMGGHEGGEIASRLAVEKIVRQVLVNLLLPALEDGTIEALQELMVNAVQEANRAIWERAQAMGTDMGTTCTAALMIGRCFYIAHVGDSRAYLYTGNQLKQLTTDHSTVGRLITLGHLDPAEAREHPLRNQLYRTVGQQPHISIDFVFQPIGEGTHLLLCSDGLWGMIDEELLTRALERNLWPQDACDELIASANLAGGEDNISAVVVNLPAATDH